MNTEALIEQLKPVFAPLAEKIGQGAEFGWKVILKQQYVEAFQAFLFGAVVVVLWLAYQKWWKYTQALTDEGERNVARFIPFALLCALTLVALLVVGSGIGHLINPEFYAIRFLLDLVKP